MPRPSRSAGRQPGEAILRAEEHGDRLLGEREAERLARRELRGLERLHLVVELLRVELLERALGPARDDRDASDLRAGDGRAAGEGAGELRRERPGLVAERGDRLL